MNKDILKNWEDHRSEEEFNAIKAMIVPWLLTIEFMLLGMHTALYSDDIALALWYISIWIWFLSLTISLERTESLKIEKIEALLENLHQKIEELKQKEEYDKEKSD